MEGYCAVGRIIATIIAATSSSSSTITITIATVIAMFTTRQQQSRGIVASQNQGLALLEQLYECEGCMRAVQAGRTKGCGYSGWGSPATANA